MTSGALFGSLDHVRLYHTFCFLQIIWPFFVKQTCNMLVYLKKYQNIFVLFFGHRVNALKINIFFSNSVDDALGDLISGLLEFQRVQNLGAYLGVPLFHENVINNTLRFVVEKVHDKLQSWDARQLSLVGRYTLAQSILLTIPSYCMQSMMNPKGLCKEIECMDRQFIWGSSNGRMKMTLVSWEFVNLTDNA